MKFSYSLPITTLFLLISYSCSQFGDSFRLPGENPKDIVLYELDNDYLAPESKYPSNNISLSYVLVGKNTYGFEADLDNDISLSFDEDGVFKLDRNHPFLKDKYKKGKIRKSDDGEKEGRDKDEKDRGKLAAAYLQNAINTAEQVIIRTELKDSRGKYGRVLGTVVCDGVDINKAMVDGYYAVAYYGQNKQEVEETHLLNRAKLIELGLFTPVEDTSWKKR